MTFGGDMGTFGAGFVLFWVVGLALSIGFVVLVAWLIAVVVRSVFRDDRGGRYGDRYGRLPGPPAEPPAPPAAPTDPLEILRLRFARGEITQEEFEQAKRILGY